MSDAFATGMRVLFSDPNLSKSGSYTAADGTFYPAVRIIFLAPTEEVMGLRQFGVTAGRIAADLLICDVPDRPKPGGTLQVADRRWKIEESRPDPRGTRWLMVLSNA